jgi:hypothetical protein
VLTRRLQRQSLRPRAAQSAAGDVAAALGGLHAQLLSSAELTLWARVDGLPQGAVARALWRDRTLVKTWAMRGTLHLLPAADYPLWQAALSTRRGHERASWLRYFGVSRSELQTVLEAISVALDGPPLTREALAAAIARESGSPALGEKMLGSWGSLLKPAAFQGRLCFGPNQGQNVRFTRPDRWLAGAGRAADGAPLDPDAALREVTRRYLTTYGPATREELGRWWGEAPPRAGAMLAALGDEIVPVEIVGAAPGTGPAWALAADVDAPAPPPSPGVCLLPAFDQYVVTAPREASPVIPAGAMSRIYRPQGWLSPVLLVDGKIAGTWRHERRGARLAVTVEPFAALPARIKKAVAGEAERLAAFTGGTLDLAWCLVDGRGQP